MCLCVGISCRESLFELSLSLFELSLSCLSWVSRRFEVQLPELSFRGSWVFCCLSWFLGRVEFSVVGDVFELIEFQLIEFQGESLVQGKLLVIHLVLLSKGERFMLIHCQIWKAEVADLKGILEIRMVPNDGGCQLWLPMYGNQGGCQQLQRGRLLFPVWGLEFVL